MARHAVPFERLNNAFFRRDLAKAAFEAVLLPVGMLDEAPVATTHRLELLDDELVAPAPPLSDRARIVHGLPNFAARRVEDALDADLAIRRRGHGGMARSGSGHHGRSPVVRPRNS